MSIGEEVTKTISVDETIPAESEPSADFAELRDVSRENYVLGDEIARGGMGVIFDARDRRTGRRLAIKEVHSAVMERDPAAVRAAVLRFRREALLTAQLQHPSIVPVYEIGRFGQTPFIAMKQVSGRPLDKLVGEADEPADRLALLPRLSAVADAIAYAHQEGVVHRDIKPANVIVGEFGETIVIDWGLAKSECDGAGDVAAFAVAGDLNTVAGAVFGTPQYMSPEQAAGGTVGAPADVYALGAILYELLTGEAPYTSELGAGAVADRAIALVCEKAPTAIIEIAPDAPSDLVSIANKAMARDPVDRYASAAEFAADLRAFSRGQLVEVHDYSTLELLRRWIGRHRALVLVAIALLVLGAASTTWFVLETIAARNDAQLQEKRATSELSRAMDLIRERGFAERNSGNLQQAAVSLATAYRLFDDTAMRIALGDVMRAIDPFIGVIHRQRGALADVSLDPASGRVAIALESRTRVLSPAGETVLEVDGIGPRYAKRGAALVTRVGEQLRVWDSSGSRLASIELPPSASWRASPSGDLVAVRANRLIIGYSATSGAETFRYDDGTDGPIFGPVVVSDDGGSVAFWQFGVKVITAATGEVVTAFAAPQTIEGPGLPIALSADGSIVATSPRSGVIELRRPGDPSQRRQLFAHGRRIRALTLANGGRTVVSVDQDGGVCFGEIRTKRVSCQLDAAVVSVTDDSTAVVTGHKNGTVSVWDFRGRPLREFAAHAPGLCYGHRRMGGEQVVTFGVDGTVRLWEFDRVPGELSLDGKTGESFGVEPPFVYTRRAEEIELWRLEDGPTKTTRIAARNDRKSLSVAGSRVVVGGLLWTIAGQTIDVPGLATASNARLSPAGQWLAFIQEDGRLELRDAAGGALKWTTDIATLEPRRYRHLPRSLSFSPRGAKLAVGSVGFDVVFDVESGTQIATLRHGDSGDGTLNPEVVFIRDERRYVSLVGHELFLYAEDGAILHTETARGAPVMAGGADHVAVAIDRRIALFGERDSAPLALIGRGAQTEDDIVAIGLSADGLIAIATAGSRVFVFDREGRVLSSRAGSPRKLAFFGESLVGHNFELISVWSMRPETRSADAVMERVLNLTKSSDR